MAVGFALVIGVPLGSLAAFNRGKAVDRTIIVICSGGVAIPSFVICTVLMYIFGVRLGWLPTIGLNSSLSYIMPVFALALLPASYVARLTRSSLLDVMEQDYIRTAKAKGVPLIMRIFKHALRNAIIPVITYIGPLLAYLVTGSMVVEKILTIPGLGGEFISSIINRDYPMIMGTTIFLAAILISMNLLVDVLYKFIDPRIQLR
jgi:oligopeptide transport system permease protein